VRGYSQIVIEANQSADPGLGVTLGALLISKKYPVSRVAVELEVSRQTVYDWISGKAKPLRSKTVAITNLIDKLSAE
jgi:predicted transcriptional regulator